MEDFLTLQTSIQSSLVGTTRSVARLAAEDLQFHRSLESSLGTQLDVQNARLLDLAKRLLGSATTSTEAVRPSLRDIDDVEENWTKVVDVIDSLLERADTALDEFTGAVKRLTPREATPNARANPSQKLYRNQELDKPQLLFEHRTDNTPKQPFQPLLTSKPHSVTPFQNEALLLEETGNLGFLHPYQTEIEQYRYPNDVYTTAEPIQYESFDEKESTLVDTEEALEAMIEELKLAKEIAVDLEHHDQRTYIGIVCLMQISTRDHDWIVDTLLPWRRKLQALNQVFADPSIVKVLHGAYMDIMWLQRDLGIYVVGLFDTYSAARALGYPGASYAYLLKHFTNVDAQKQYQMADWRIRPLPKELIDYARSDTHYLLYIFDNMRNELIDRSTTQSDKIQDVLEASKETALQRYEYPVYDAESGQGANGWYKLLYRTPANFTKEQFAVFRAVHQWRDHVAREQDDSIHFVMPNHVIFTLAKTIPTTNAEVLKLAQPLTQTLRLRVDELVAVITNAKETGTYGPEMMELLNEFDPLGAKKIAAQASHDKPTPKIDGISGYINRLRSENSVISSLPLRSLVSRFWGSSLNNTTKREMSTANIQMSVPLPVLTPGTFEEMSTIEVELATPEAPPAVVETPEDDVFILKELGRKRKLTEFANEDDGIVDEADEDDGMAAQADEVILPNGEAEIAQLKAEKKRAKREARRAAKVGVTSMSNEAEEPFDYASAPSMLNQRTQDKKVRKGKKTFNPYVGSADAARGLPRVQKETNGKSMTYAS